MCLLIAIFQMLPDAPLVVAANRDERADRAAVSMTMLRVQAPRILGGRDETAGGTWLAVNEYGVVAGLTNQPSAAGRDPSKRSRGELPLAFAACTTAADAIGQIAATLDPARYNACWMLVGDRDTLFSVAVSGDRPDVVQLGPGLHVLENAPVQAESAKARFVRQLTEQALAAQVPAEPADPLLPAQPDRPAASTVAALELVLRSHEPAVPEPRTDATGRVWPASLSAACVHGDGYGTRSSMTVVVPAGRGLPEVRVADGKPCQTEFADATGLWAAGLRTVAADPR